MCSDAAITGTGVTGAVASDGAAVDLIGSGNKQLSEGGAKVGRQSTVEPMDTEKKKTCKQHPIENFINITLCIIMINILQLEGSEQLTSKVEIQKIQSFSMKLYGEGKNFPLAVQNNLYLLYSITFRSEITQIITIT